MKLIKMSIREELNGTSNILNLISYYDENKDNDWKEWLSFDTVFNKPSKQGIVGLLEMKNNTSDKLVFKISQYINYLTQHESIVMKGLNTLSSYCPHFCRSIGTILCDVEPKCKIQMLHELYWTIFYTNMDCFEGVKDFII